MELKAGRGRLQTGVGPLCATGTIHISSVSKRYFRDALRKYLFLMQNSHSVCHEHIRHVPALLLTVKLLWLLLMEDARNSCLAQLWKQVTLHPKSSFWPWQHVFMTVFCAATKSVTNVSIQTSEFLHFFCIWFFFYFPLQSTVTNPRMSILKSPTEFSHLSNSTVTSEDIHPWQI